MERVSLEQSLIILYQDIFNIRLKNKSKEDFDKAYVYIKSFFSLLDIDFPKGPYKLNKVYDDEIIKTLYLFMHELIILLFYMDYRNLGLKLSDVFIFNAPSYIDKNGAIFNQKFYTNQLKLIKNKKLEISLDSIWHPLNPSIIKTDNGYIISVRSVNYILNEQGSYILPEGVNISQSINYMLTTDEHYNIVNQKEIKDVSSYQKYEGSRFQGLEDLIIFNYNNDVYCTCTTLDTNPQRIPQISLCKFNENYDIIEKIPLKSPNGNMQKNWLPFVINNQIKIVYGYSPFVLLDYNNSDYNLIVLKQYGLDFANFKGSTAPIIFDTGYLFMIHETHNINVYLRCYLHRFIWMTLDFEIKKISNPWYLHYHGVEFCRSMQWNHLGSEIIIGYGIHDKEAYIGSVDPDYVRSLLLDLDEFTF